MITDIAHNAVTALGIIPDENVSAGNIDNPDWNGTPVIVITDMPARQEDMTQMYMVCASTPLAVHCIAKTRQDAWHTVRQAAIAVYKTFTALETEPESGILCITFNEYHVVPIPERNAFQAYVTFNVLHQ
jgi:hypothetical protein